MRSRSEHETNRSGAPHELAILSEVLQNSDTTQRELADRVGLSLGATNLLLQSLVGKGYLRIRRAGWRRRLYALTPTGITRKITLTTGYVSRFLDQYRQVRSIIAEQFDPAVLEGNRVAVYGSGEMVRLVLLVLDEAGIQGADAYVPTGTTEALSGLSVRSLADMSIADYDRFIVAAIDDAEARYQELTVAEIDPDRIHTLFSFSGKR